MEIVRKKGRVIKNANKDRFKSQIIESVIHYDSLFATIQWAYLGKIIRDVSNIPKSNQIPN